MNIQNYIYVIQKRLHITWPSPAGGNQGAEVYSSTFSLIGRLPLQCAALGVIGLSGRIFKQHINK